MTTHSKLAERLDKVLNFSVKSYDDNGKKLGQELSMAINNKIIMIHYNNKLHSDIINYICTGKNKPDTTFIDQYDEKTKEFLKCMFDIVLKNHKFNPSNKFHVKYSYLYLLKYLSKFHKKYIKKYEDNKIKVNNILTKLNEISKNNCIVKKTNNINKRLNRYYIDFDINKVQPGTKERHDTIIFLQNNC